MLRENCGSKLVESLQRTETMSIKIEQMSERISDAHRQLGDVGSRLERGELHGVTMERGLQGCHEGSKFAGARKNTP